MRIPFQPTEIALAVARIYGRMPSVLHASWFCVFSVMPMAMRMLLDRRIR